MAFPTNEQQIKALLDNMKAKGASEAQKKAVIDAYIQRQEASSQSFLGKATQEISNTATNLSEGTQENLSKVQEQLGEKTGIGAPPVVEPPKDPNAPPGLGQTVLETIAPPVAAIKSAYTEGESGETVKSGLEKMKQGGEAMLDSVKENIAEPPSLGESVSSALLGPIPGLIKQMSDPEFTGGTADVIGGGMEAAFAPISTVINKTPGLNTLAQKVSEGTNALSTYLGDKMGKTPEEKEALTKSFNNLINLGMIKYTPKVIEKVTPIVKPVVNFMGKKLRSAGAAISGEGLPVTAAEAKMMQNYEANIQITKNKLLEAQKTGDATAIAEIKKTLADLKENKPVTLGQTAVENGLSGTKKTIGLKSKIKQEEIWKQKIEPALKEANEVMSKDELFAELEKIINETAEPGRKNVLQEGYEALKQDYVDKKAFTYPEAQSIKSGLDEFTPSKVFRGKEVADGYNQMRANLADLIRNKIYDGLKDQNIKRQYLHYSNLLELEKLGILARTQKAGLFRAGGTGTLLRDLWDTATIPVETKGGMYIYKVGDYMIESPILVKTMGEYLKYMGVDKKDLF